MIIERMPVPKDMKLYEKARRIADETYKKPSAYKSGFIVKTYKDMGGTYEDDKKHRPLKQWFKEEWKDVGKEKYPVYRPTKVVSSSTPLTASEISPANLKKQIDKKQRIKGKKNLAPFQAKYTITDYTKKRAKEIGVDVRPSTHEGKKIDVYKDGEYIDSIGAVGYYDYPTYMKEKGKEYAEERKRLYHIRHTKDTQGELLARWLLW
jgi:hypothetical protein